MRLVGSHREINKIGRDIVSSANLCYNDVGDENE